VSPVRQFVTVVSIVGGSAGVPSACSSLKVRVIQSSCPGPDGQVRIRDPAPPKTSTLLALFRPSDCL
jgi:hypothetical protein